MITQEFTIRCQAPSAWLDPTSVSTARGDNGEVVCTQISVIEATSVFDAKRTFQQRGWYVSEDGRTYCRTHSENARRLERIAREKAKAAHDNLERQP